MATLNDVQSGFETLSPEEKTRFVSTLDLPQPTPGGTNVVWVLVLTILGIVIVGGGILVYQLVVDGTDASLLVGFVSAALGAIIGLIAPSPVSNGD